MNLTEIAESIIAGALRGTVFPPRANPIPPPTITARDIAMSTLCDYIAMVQFATSTRDGDKRREFSVQRSSIFDEWPDDETRMPLPAVALVSARGSHVEEEFLGMPPICKETVGKYAPGTALVELSTYTESFAVEAWAASRAERRALAAGLTLAMRPSEGTLSLNLRLPNYFDRVAEFTLEDSWKLDDIDARVNRRRCLFFVTLSVPEVQLIDIVTMRPRLVLDVQDGQAVALAEIEAARAQLVTTEPGG